MSTREEHAGALLEAHTNDWGGSHLVEELVGHRWAVVIERYSDSWVLGIDTVEDIANAELECLTTDGDEIEWIEGVYDLDTGQRVAFKSTTTVTTTLESGERAVVSR